MQIKMINFQIKGDSRGDLIALEESKNIPFVIKRVYYIFNTKDGVRRGLHAHKNLNQVLVCMSGSCKILLDNGKQDEEIFELNSPSKALYLESNIWREMFDFSSDCILMVLASEYYNEGDYIRDYTEFVEYIKNLE